MTNEDPVQAAINDLSNAIVEFIDAKVREPKAQDWHLFMMDDLHSELTLAIAGFADAVRNDTIDSIAAGAHEG